MFSTFFPFVKSMHYIDCGEFYIDVKQTPVTLGITITTLQYMSECSQIDIENAHSNHISRWSVMRITTSYLECCHCKTGNCVQK